VNLEQFKELKNTHLDMVATTTKYMGILAVGYKYILLPAKTANKIMELLSEGEEFDSYSKDKIVPLSKGDYQLSYIDEKEVKRIKMINLLGMTKTEYEKMEDLASKGEQETTEEN
jgi:uncharacterized metal-binding protein